MSNWGMNEDEVEKPNSRNPTKREIDLAESGGGFMESLAHTTIIKMLDENSMKEWALDNLAYVGAARVLLTSVEALDKAVKDTYSGDAQEVMASVVMAKVLKEIIEKGGELENINDGKA